MLYPTELRFPLLRCYEAVDLAGLEPATSRLEGDNPPPSARARASDKDGEGMVALYLLSYRPIERRHRQGDGTRTRSQEPTTPCAELLTPPPR